MTGPDVPLGRAPREVVEHRASQGEGEAVGQSGESAETLKTICAWCGLLIHDGALPISHGMCKPCAAEFAAKIFAATIGGEVMAFAKRKDVAEPIVESPLVELELGGSRVVLVQRFGDCMRITTAHRVKRTLTDALVLGGTVLLPLNNLSTVLQEIRKAARKKVHDY